jgi:hydroxymethylpyrimidine pyrophosphatase-like HAD family hydrolase
MAACRLLAIDLDGTLVRDDGEIAPEDVAAVARAQAHGVKVTLATGRLGPAALPLARALDLGDPMVCADGGATFCPRTSDLLEVSPVPLTALQTLLDAAREGDVTPFFVTPESIVGPRGARMFGALSGFSPHLVAADDLWEVALDGPPVPVVAAFGVGSEAGARALRASFPAAGHGDNGVDTDVFQLGDGNAWALRLTLAGASKGEALERLAAELEAPPAEVAVIGDWYNDIAMFRWAHHSYAMGQAPAPVAQAARHRLHATARTGGGVAEAIEHLLGRRNTV